MTPTPALSASSLGAVAKEWKVTLGPESAERRPLALPLGPPKHLRERHLRLTSMFPHCFARETSTKMQAGCSQRLESTPYETVSSTFYEGCPTVSTPQ